MSLPEVGDLEGGLREAPSKQEAIFRPLLPTNSPSIYMAKSLYF